MSHEFRSFLWPCAELFSKWGMVTSFESQPGGSGAHVALDPIQLYPVLDSGEYLDGVIWNLSIDAGALEMTPGVPGSNVYAFMLAGVPTVSAVARRRRQRGIGGLSP